MLQVSTASVSGEELLQLFQNDYAKFLVPRFLGRNPDVAVERIVATDGEMPDSSGCNSSSIFQLRDLLFQVITNCLYNSAAINAFAIVAPHTHWTEETAMSYELQPVAERYVIGPHPLMPKTIYAPVSFAFSAAGLIPYEWIAVDDYFDLAGWNIALDILKKINEEIKGDYPLGLSIDFRFKEQIFEPSLNSVEMPIENKLDNYCGFSEILKGTSKTVMEYDGALGQVAWHPFSDKALGMTDDELIVLQEMRRYLSKMESQQERLDFLCGLSH